MSDSVVAALRTFLPSVRSMTALGLLELRPSECTPARIEAALARQLDRISAHAQGHTPEADDLALALHTAAAQLHDPEIRALIVRDAIDQDSSFSSPFNEANPADFHADHDSHEPPPFPQPPHFDSRVVRTSTSPEPSSLSTQPAAVEAFPQPELFESQPAPKRSRRPLIAGLVILAFLLSLGLGIIALTSSVLKPSTPVASAPTPSAPTPAPKAVGDQVAAPPRPRPVVVPPPPTRSDYTDAPTVISELRASAALARTDPAAGAQRLLRPMTILGDWWARYETPQRRAADDAIVECLYILGSASQGGDIVLGKLRELAVLPPAASGPLSKDRIWPAAWATGLLTRTVNERELPRSIAAGVDALLNDAIGAGRASGALSFEAGALSALQRMPLLMVAPPATHEDGTQSTAPRTSVEAVKRWTDVIALVSGDPVAAERSYTDALEEILTLPIDPEADLAVYEAVEVLATRVRWRDGGPARPRLLAWFDDERLSVSDLRTLTSVLATKSNAEGVDASMILSITATADDRARLRGQYAKTWGLAGTLGGDHAAAQWRSAATNLLSAPAAERDDVARVLAFLETARMNEAARKLWLGDAVDGAKLIDQTRSIIEGLRAINPAAAAPGAGTIGAGSGKVPGTTASGSSGSLPDYGSWAANFVRAERSIPLRLQRLQEALALPRPVSRTDAEILVETALLGSPVQVRDAAQRAVTRLADEPAIVRACLDLLPSAPRIRSVGLMLDSVCKGGTPRPGDPDWEVVTRRSLVERLLTLLAAQSVESIVDRASGHIADSYFAMSGAQPLLGKESDAERLLRAVSTLHSNWRLEADRQPIAMRAPLALPAIDAKRASRREIAVGPVQQFAGEQVSLAELLGYLICAERPSMADRVGIVLRDLSHHRRQSDDVFQQMLMTERAMTRLWLARLNIPDPLMSAADSGAASPAPAPAHGGGS